jgi:hypothetical protein
MQARNYQSTLVSVTTSETALLGVNAYRKALILFNQGAADVQVYFDSNSTIYYTLEAGQGMHFPEAPINALNAKTSSGTASVTVMVA